MMEKDGSIHAKIVLLGGDYVGKTNLLDRYINDRYMADPPHPSTVGSAFGKKTLVINGRRVTLDIWDTAGNERYQELTCMYYREAKAAVMCFDLAHENSFNRARFWIRELQKQGQKEVKIYLCATKCDFIEEYPAKRVISPDTVHSLAVDCMADFFETSSKTGKNVEEMFTKIAEDYLNRRTETGDR